MIEGSTFNIRHVHKNDLETFNSLKNNLRLRGEYLPNNIVSSTAMEKAFGETCLSTDDRETLLIVDKQDKIIGALWHFKSVPYFSAIEIGYQLFSVEHRGAGITTEAVRLMSAYLFETKTVNRLEIRMDTRNAASEKVAIKCHYQKEGVSRAANYVRGKYVDMAVYSLLRNEWSDRS